MSLPTATETPVRPGITPPSNRTIAGAIIVAMAVGLLVNAAAFVVAGSPAGSYAPGVMIAVLALLLGIVGAGAVIDERCLRRG